MTLSERALVAAAAVLASLVAATSAVAYPTDLSTGISLPGAPNATMAVYAYNPGTGTWTQMSNVSRQEVSTSGHSAYVFEATAPQPTDVSTFRVIFAVHGMPLEVFMTPDALRRMDAGESTTLRINLF